MSDRLDSLCDVTAVEEPPVTDRSAACRVAVRAFRPRRVLPATVTASLLMVASASAAVQVISIRLGRPALGLGAVAPAGRLVHTLTWSDPVVMATGGGVLLSGLLLVLSAALPGRTGTAALAGDDPTFVTGLGRASLREILRGTATGVPGVTRARVALRGRLRPRAHVRAVTGRQDPGNLEEQVAYAVYERLVGLGPVRIPEVVVRVVQRAD